MPEQKIVVIGDEDAVFGLGLIGIEGHSVRSVQEASEAIRNARADPNTALILLTENWSEARPGSMDDSGPLVVEVPSQAPAASSITLEAQIERTLGVHLEH